MEKEEDILNECGHRNSERLEALKILPSAVCPACLIERTKKLEAALNKYGEHQAGCMLGDACNCGFNKALKG